VRALDEIGVVHVRVGRHDHDAVIGRGVEPDRGQTDLSHLFHIRVVVRDVRAGRLEQLEDDLAQRKALDLVAESAKPITVEQAKERGRLYTKVEDEAPEGAEADTAGS
jgi:hypothetical protein